MKKALIKASVFNIFLTGLYTSYLSATSLSNQIIFDTYDNVKESKESCPYGSAYGYSSWSKPKVDFLGLHPDTKNWANVSNYTYTEGHGPKLKANIGYGPFTYIAGDLGGAAKTIPANIHKQSRLSMKVYFKTRTYKRKSSYPCETISTFRQYRVDHEAYYAKYR